MTKKTDLPLYECPRYDRCSVNNCPMHPDFPNLFIDENDEEQKCTIEKQVRMKIAAKFPGVLQFEGLTPREFSARKKWENLDEISKERIRENALKARSCIGQIVG